MRDFGIASGRAKDVQQSRITRALAILNAVPDFDPATASRAQIRTMWLAHYDAVRA